MAFITADRVKDTSTTTGTGNITVSGSAPFGYRTFSTVLSVNDTFYYCIQGQGTAEWEVGVGTYVSINQFARTTVLASSASGSAVSFSSGTKNVFITLAASKTLQLGPSDGPTAGSIPYGTGSTLAYTAAGTLGQVLQSNGSGAPTWGTAGTSSPGGSDTQVQYNNSGSFAGSSNLTFNGTTLTANAATVSSGNLTFAGTGQRITGDFSNATIANRLAFQSSTVNGNTNVYFIPNGTATTAGITYFNSSNISNSSYGSVTITSSSMIINSTYLGTGTYLPITFNTGGSEQVRIGATTGTDLGTVGIGYSTLTGVGTNGLAVSGNVGIGTSSPANKLQVQNAGATQIRVSEATGTYYFDFGRDTSDGLFQINGNQGSGYKWINASTEAMRIDASGNVGIGTTTPAIYAKFSVIGGSIYTDAALYSSDGTTVSRVISSGGVSYWGTTTNQPVVYQTNNTERMRIDSSGNVGIGAAPGTNANNIQPLTVYSQGPSNLTIKQGTSSSPKTASNSPLIWAQNYIKYDTPGDPFAQNVGGVFADVEVVNDATAGTQINGTWNAIIGNSVNNGINWGTSTSQNWSTKGSAIGVTGFARANGFPGDSQIITGLWGYPQGPTLDATTYANLPSGANWSLCGLEVNIQINHPDIGEKSILVGQGSSVGALLSNYRTAGTGVKDWTFGVAYIGSPDDGNYSSTNVDNWNGFYCGILLDKIKAKGIRFGQYFKTGSYGIYFPDSYAGTQEPAAAIYMGNSKINMGQYTGSSFNNQDLWHNGGQLYWKYGGLTFPLMQMASSYTATVTALAGYILVKDDAGNYRKVAVMA